MSQLITVKFLPPTNTRGSRFKASCDAGQIIIDQDCRYNADITVKRAVRALLEKLEWSGLWVGGYSLKTGWGFVCADKDCEMEVRG